MVDSARLYPKVGNGETREFPEKHIAMVGKGSTQVETNYLGMPFETLTGTPPEMRVRNMYAKNPTGPGPTAEQITPNPAPTATPGIDSSKPERIPF
jgi:hypothetical protein